mmetsp:Transcript_29790/g.45428  ORF Transcript_29790/g.45428 Transcript_29790/m.45428 type:complete len:111 (+) Transcript_29790:806-1138(+)
MHDVKCRIRREALSHWLFEGIGVNEFLVSHKTKWESHPVNVTTENIDNVQENYTTLAAHQDGTMIAQHFGTIATIFRVSKTQKETVQMLRNFLEFNLRRLRDEGCLGERL